MGEPITTYSREIIKDNYFLIIPMDIAIQIMSYLKSDQLLSFDEFDPSFKSRFYDNPYFWEQLYKYKYQRKPLKNMLINKHTYIRSSILLEEFDAAEIKRLQWYVIRNDGIQTRKEYHLGEKLGELIKLQDKEGIYAALLAGVDLNKLSVFFYDTFGYWVYPIEYVVKHNLYDMTKLLVTLGANINIQTHGLQSILGIAVKNGNIEIIKYLLSMGADVNLSGKITYQSPVLMEAIIIESLPIVKLLVEAGTDINYIFEDGKSYLHFSSVTPEIIEYLVDKGLNINHVDINGQTPLMVHVIKRIKINVIKLLELGANRDIVDLRGLTAKDYARKCP